MRPLVELQPKDEAVVEKVYRKYDAKEDKWYSSDVPKAGYNIISYRSSKGSVRLFYNTKEKAQQEVDKYNKRILSYRLGRAPDFPDEIMWEDLAGTEFHNQYVWEHDDGGWMYGRWHGWDIRTLLLDPLMDYKYPIDGKSTRDFFNLLFSMPRFRNFYLKDRQIYYRG